MKAVSGGIGQGADRRLDPRRETSEAAKAVSADGQVFEVMVVDRSIRGMRIHTAAAASLPTELTILAPCTGSVHLARIVWRTAPYAGLLLTRTIEMRSAMGSDTADARRLWRMHVTSG